jgi:hypothetical protein
MDLMHSLAFDMIRIGRFDCKWIGHMQDVITTGTADNCHLPNFCGLGSLCWMMSRCWLQGLLLLSDFSTSCILQAFPFN